ncbi:hypothetical protein DSM106972_067590 [Dulcicalothrix desertica PCC 7102]|uniref:Transferase n=1 Tax=Dulcicalothrix desertica PCC 7102 TaxID=232991 RepID=A0A433V540_9CYAN|nr:DapH/DapD/GlmU-related protein [Dulcicalothrix desertica]RUT01208.1 hypothetical protein DSM106972_067590 [Dulcicalothrix desertica PCC 7102]TWH40642.1 galactoside O-acetyltransferase [Dulcicalothrix desertica PCC 7102]
MMYQNQTVIERLKELFLITCFGNVPVACLGLELRNFIYKSIFKQIDNHVFIQEGAKFFGTKCIEISQLVHILEGVCIDARDVNSHIVIKDGVILKKRVTIKALLSTNIYIGERTLIDDDVYIIGLGSIKIGKDCFIGDNSVIFAMNHILNNVSTKFNSVTKKEIIIEDECWLGHGVTVLNGVTIGKGSVISPNSVVTENIPPYSNAEGIPARVIKSRQKY